MAFEEQDILAIVLWQMLVYVVFTLSYMPVWRSRWFHDWDLDGWQLGTTKSTASAAMKAKLLYPPWWLCGPLWWILYSLAGFSIWHAVRSMDPGPVLNATFIMFLVYMWIHGTWTIWFWYYGLPFWSILHLGFAAVLGTVYLVVVSIGFSNLVPLWLGIPIVLFDWIATFTNLFLFLAYTNRYIGSPLEAFCARGFNPIPTIYHYERFHHQRTKGKPWTKR